MKTCDKCGQPVPPENDATVLEETFLKIRGFPLPLILKNRHLFPIKEGERVVCEGSPSRVQYLEGQPRDQRPQVRYNPDDEVPFREAYKQMLQTRRERH